MDGRVGKRSDQCGENPTPGTVAREWTPSGQADRELRYGAGAAGFNKLLTTAWTFTRLYPWMYVLLQVRNHAIRSKGKIIRVILRLTPDSPISNLELM